MNRPLEPTCAQLAIAILALCHWGGSLVAADALPSKTTYSKAYGPTKGTVEVDPAKDLPRYPAVAPGDAIATWKIKPGFKLQLAAHEPQVRDPIAISFDEKGRMFVVEMIDYSEMRDSTPHLGRVSMLEDRDGDSYYETSSVFADDLAWPTGILCANGGIYVIATPDVWFFKDTKGAGRADVREKVFTGFGTGLKLLNVQGLANCPQWGLDNRIHIQAGGGNRGKVKCLKRPDLPEIELGGKDFWFDPRTLEFGLEAGGGQFGMSFDNYGRKFACSNSDHLQYFVYDERYAARNSFYSMPSPRQSIAADGGAAEVFRISPDEPWRIVRTRWRIAGVVKGVVEGGGRVSGYFTGATGTTVYRGDAYGPDFVNNTFTGDAGGQLVHRKILHPDGASLTGRRPEDEQGFEFAASRDTWVRVVNFANAPDGCLHVIDMYREVIEHPWSIPDEIKKHLDLNNGNNRGRIYRIVPDKGGWQRRTKVNLADADTAALVQILAHPNGWHRDTAARLLYEKRDKAAIPLLEKLLNDSANPLAKIHALGALDGFGAVSCAALSTALGDPDDHVKERACALVEAHIARKPSDSLALFDPLRRLALSESQRVQFAALLALPGFLAVEGDQVSDAIQDGVVRTMAQAYSGARSAWIRHAIAGSDSNLSAWTLGLLETIAPESLASAAPLIETTGARNIPDELSGVFMTLASLKPTQVPGVLRALGAGLKRAGSSLRRADKDKQLERIFSDASATVSDARVTDAERIEAISLVSLDEP
ncbi:MAG: PVC-type heme-binding CxxCH protein, partial [Chthoniobacteraceae bacterium]